MSQRTSKTAAIGDAIVAELKAKTWSHSFETARSNYPDIALEDLTKATHVTVLPTGRGRDELTRKQHAGQYKIDIAIRRHIGDDLAASDELMALQEEIEEFFDDSHKLTTLPEARVLEVTTPVVADAENAKKGIFFGVCRLTVLMNRSRTP